MTRDIHPTLSESFCDCTISYLKLILFCFVIVSVGYADSTTVESDDAHYNGDTITLTGHVMIEHSMGKVIAEKATLKKDKSKRTKLQFPWIELKHNICFTLKDGGVLTCETLILDHTLMSSILIGAPQVYYSDHLGEIYADRARIDYQEVNGTVEATKVTLYDHVHLVNLGTTEHPASQYALADEVVYYPQEQLAILEGTNGRVLFYDALKNIQISAKSVHASRHPETHHEQIQGQGDVRFVLGPEELGKIKEHFQIR